MALLITLAASLVVNLAALALLKIGLRDGEADGGCASHQPC